MEKRFVPLLIMLGFLIILIITPIIGALFEVPIIALDEPDISIASFDYWSVGHLLWGVAIFVVFFTIGFIAKNLTGNPQAPINPPGYRKFIIYWLITLGLAGIWEIIENTLLYAVGIKVELDSAVNVITDITLWGFGGLISWYMTDLMFLSEKYIRAYYIYGVMCLIMGVLIFVFFGFLTTAN
ncbi:MAG: hypothetical protein ACFFA3_15665 [Promethearchaeota archaeon]